MSFPFSISDAHGPVVYLERQFGGGFSGTKGIFYIASTGTKLISLELPWIRNETFISCIPSGIYQTVQHTWTKNGLLVPRLKNVIGREGILIHPANKLSEIEGCVMTGMSAGVELINDYDVFQWYTRNSRKAFDILIDEVGYEFTLVVYSKSRLPE